MAGWLHGVFVGEWIFVFPLCGFSLSLFCNYQQFNAVTPTPPAHRSHSCMRALALGYDISPMKLLALNTSFGNVRVKRA